MDRLYVSTFIAGTGEIVKAALGKALPGFMLVRLDDGIVFYRAKAGPERVKMLRFLQNTFELLSSSDALDSADPLKSLVKHIREDDELPRRLGGLRGRYKLQASLENQLTALHPIQRQKLEKRLAEFGLQPAGQKPDCELWLMVRREGYGFLGLRITKHDTYDHKLQQGELKPDLAHLLCLLSEPKPSDVFLDPMAGSGAIPFERAKAFPYEKILLGDEHLSKFVKDTAKRFKKMMTGGWDARTLEGIGDASVDAIVTDPPWGKFLKSDDIPEFYRSMLKAFVRVLKPSGRAVILAGRDGPLELLADGSGLRAQAHHDILVNGQKATVWVLKKS